MQTRSTTLCQSGPMNNSNEEVLHTLKSSRIGAPSPDRV